MNKLSVLVIVRNEEKNIARCLQSAVWADEIILVDQTSVDKTVELARAYTDKIFLTEPKGISEPDRELAISKAENTWVLMLDADEVISPELKAELAAVLSNPGAEVYMLPRKTYFNGKPVLSCGWYPSYVPRLFIKGKVRFGSGVHQDGEPQTDKVAYLKNDLLHYTYRSVSEWLEKFDRYTSRAALEQYEAGRKISHLSYLKELFVRPLYFFLLKYFWLKGIKDGWRGFFISVSSGLVIFFTFIKLLELRERKS